MINLFNLTLQIFEGTVVISFVVFLFVVGLFTFYLGIGRDWKGGFAMVLMSVLVISAYFVLLMITSYGFSIVYGILEPALFFLVAMVIGAGIGLVIFLAILIKY
jgi:hypothetical protein